MSAYPTYWFEVISKYKRAIHEKNYLSYNNYSIIHRSFSAICSNNGFTGSAQRDNFAN